MFLINIFLRGLFLKNISKMLNYIFISSKKKLYLKTNFLYFKLFQILQSCNNNI